jgi:decaprenylphospho-beta-D-erythro-pentofuranosid-2-ulose 2-reductase
MKTVMIMGATSAIAIACARIWAAQGAELILLARDENRLRQVAADLMARGAAKTVCAELDLNELTTHEQVLAQIFSDHQRIDICLIATGTLPDQAVCTEDSLEAVRHFQTNAVSVIAFLTTLVQRLRHQQQGAVAVITSVAGDRGRPSNFYYGSAKAAVSVFLAGLRAALFRHGLTVTDIRPGFVATPMTAELKLPALLVVSPEKVAIDIVRAIERGKAVCYTPGFWRWIMWLIRHIPDIVFKRLSL